VKKNFLMLFCNTVKMAVALELNGNSSRKFFFFFIFGACGFHLHFLFPHVFSKFEFTK